MRRAIGMTGRGFGPMDECLGLALSFSFEQDEGWEEIRQVFPALVLQKWAAMEGGASEERIIKDLRNHSGGLRMSGA